MDLSHDDIINFYNKNIKPFVAIFILAFLVTSCYLLYEENQLKKEISQNCGWETKEYKCYCDKSFVENLELKLNDSLLRGENIKNVTLVSGYP